MKNIFKTIFSSRLAKSASVYTISSFLNSAIPFLMLPVLTRYLSTAEYGQISMINATASFILPFIILGFSIAIQREIIKSDPEKVKEYAGSGIMIIFVAAIVIFGIFFLLKGEISALTEIPEKYILLIVLMALSSSLINVASAVLQILDKPRIYAFYQNLCTLLDLSLSIMFIVALGFGLDGRVLGIVIAKLIFAVVGVFIVVRFVGIRLTFNLDNTKDIVFNYGIPMIPTEIKSTILTYTDKIFITKMVSIDQTGIYSVGNQFSLPIMLLTYAFSMAFLPYLYRKLDENTIEAKKNIVKITYIYFAAIIAITIIWAIVSNPIIHFFVGADFYGASSYVFLLSMGYAFTGMHMMVVNYIYYYKKIKRYTIITISVILINVILNYVFILAFGTVGAALATMVANFISFVLTWLLVMKICDMPWFTMGSKVKQI